MALLGQRVNAFELFTVEEKLTAIRDIASLLRREIGAESATFNCATSFLECCHPASEDMKEELETCAAEHYCSLSEALRSQARANHQ